MTGLRAAVERKTRRKRIGPGGRWRHDRALHQETWRKGGPLDSAQWVAGLVLINGGLRASETASPRGERELKRSKEQVPTAVREGLWGFLCPFKTIVLLGGD